MKNNILAVVVTYNRKELLKENIEALINQEYNKLDILVINNKSTDGTEEILSKYKSEYENFDYITLPENIGGAGGFSYGVKEAIIKKYDYLWLMDDDTIPNTDALKSLVNKSELLNDDFSYLASVVNWTDGSFCTMNTPKEKNLFYNHFKYIKSGLIEIESSSFVACYINLKEMKQYGLPIKEFFIYGDDVEYTSRLSSHKTAYLDIDSIVIHKMKQNGKDTRFVTTDKNRISRIYYDYRNNFYILKRKGAKEVVKFILRYFAHFIKYIIRSPKYRLLKIWYMTKGMCAGIFFNPLIEYVSEDRKGSGLDEI
jgi:GT2 family glycosyltransferase